jgi:hypothetical protein
MARSSECTFPTTFITAAIECLKQGTQTKPCFCCSPDTQVDVVMIDVGGSGAMSGYKLTQRVHTFWPHGDWVTGCSGSGRACGPNTRHWAYRGRCPRVSPRSSRTQPKRANRKRHAHPDPRISLADARPARLIITRRARPVQRLRGAAQERVAVPILPPAGLAQEAEGRRDATVVVVVCDIRKLTGVIETEPSSGEAAPELGAGEVLPRRHCSRADGGSGRRCLTRITERTGAR